MTSDPDIGYEDGRPWEERDEESLRAYASQWDDMERGSDPAEMDWVFVAALPVPLGPEDRDWAAWWEDQRAEAAENGMDGLWDYLLDEEIEEPVVLDVHPPEDGRPRFGFRDGNHRVGATVVSGRERVPAVVGIERGLTLEDLPGILRALPEFAAWEERRTASAGPKFG